MHKLFFNAADHVRLSSRLMPYFLLIPFFPYPMNSLYASITHSYKTASTVPSIYRSILLLLLLSPYFAHATSQEHMLSNHCNPSSLFSCFHHNQNLFRISSGFWLVHIVAALCGIILFRIRNYVFSSVNVWWFNVDKKNVLRWNIIDCEVAINGFIFIW